MRRALLLLVLLSACADAPGSAPVASSPELTPSSRPSPSPTVASPSPDPTRSPTPTPEPVATLLAAGDVAGCDVDGDSATAALISTLDGVVALLGDAVYPAGSTETFTECYDPAWGPLLERTRPAVGNHDLQADAGAAYYAYFGDRAGTPGEGWYSFEHGDWHVVALNSNCELIACGPGSAQHDWLVADLAGSDAVCTVAFMHHPRFSSGPHGDYLPVAPLWDALHADGADLVLVGHDHLYERFTPQLPSGVADPNGVRQITVGTGGYVLYAAQRIAPNSELIIDDTHGVLELTLSPDSYAWRFLAVSGVVADEGSGACH